MTPTKYTQEEKAALVEEFLAEYRESRCYTTEFSRKKGINEATFLGWVRRYDEEGRYPRYPQFRGKRSRQALVKIGGTPEPAVSGGVSIAYDGCTIRLGEQFTSEEVAKVLVAIREVR